MLQSKMSRAVAELFQQMVIMSRMVMVMSRVMMMQQHAAAPNLSIRVACKHTMPYLPFGRSRVLLGRYEGDLQ